jgi:hypothetical protein
MMPAAESKPEIGSDPTVGLRELSRLTGVRASRIAALLRDAGVPRGHDKRWPRAVAVGALNAGRDLSKAAGRRVAGMNAAPNSDPAISDLATARTATERMRSERLRLMVESAEGKLVDRQKVEATAKAFTESLRASFLAIPSRCAPNLVGVGTEAAVREILDAEIRLALSQTATLVQRLAPE